MTGSRPRVGGPPARKTRLREPDGAAGGDFAWPPPVDDPAGCSIVALDADAGPRPRVRSTLPADARMELFPEIDELFPEIDIETALDAFADVPAVPTALTTAPAASPHGLPATPSPASWWRAAPFRGIVAFGVGAALALLPPPGLPPLEAARPLPAARTPDLSGRTELPSTSRRRIGLSDGVHLATASVIDARSSSGVAPRDEDRIRATLAELGAAYSKLDAGAAREVWPSVDVEALARAFDSLRSQELRFDHCDVTVNGVRARADCTGQAIYVPRAGEPGFNSAARAWTFELTRMRGRWMIASGRAS